MYVCFWSAIANIITILDMFKLNMGMLQRLWDGYFHPEKAAEALSKKTDNDARRYQEPSVCATWLRFITGLTIFVVILGVVGTITWEGYHMRKTWVDLAAKDAKILSGKKDMWNNFCQEEGLDNAKQWERMGNDDCTAADRFIRGDPNSRIFDVWTAEHLAHLSFMSDFCRDGFCRQIILSLVSLFGWGTIGAVLILLVIVAVVGTAALKTVVNPASQMRRSMSQKSSALDVSLPKTSQEADRRVKQQQEIELQRVMDEGNRKTTTLPPPMPRNPGLISGLREQPWMSSPLQRLPPIDTSSEA